MIDTVKAGELMGPPVTFELANKSGYAAITEAGLVDFGGMSLKAKGNSRLEVNLSGLTRKKGLVETPWRIIEIGKDLNALVNCDIIANVSPAYDKRLFPKGYETDWVKPGRSVWSWLAKTRAVTLENMKHFSDLAAQLGFEYNLVDEGWGKWRDTVNGRDSWGMMKELVDYSATKGVKIWVWKAYPDRAGIAGINTHEKRKAFFKKCKDIGVAGLKIDFFDSESQEIINFYQAALRDAAEYQLMIDFHGANKPTGESRTWPNEMTREAIRGMENRPPWGVSNTTLPFTRYLAGHADYTPVHFGERMGEVSWAHHVASAIVFTSPFLCYGADPQSILDNPAKEIIQSIPSTWDETIVLPQSKIGQLVLYARRKGNSWFLAAMNGEAEMKNITVDLSFLKKGIYKTTFIKDDPAKQASGTIGIAESNSSTAITINLNPNGGYAARLDKVN
jgi:alpha-glucosidase